MRIYSRGHFGTLSLRIFVVVSAAWTFFSIFMLLKWVFTHDSEASAQAQPIYSTIELPTLSPEMLYQDLPGIQQSLTAVDAMLDSSRRPARLAVVYQSDSTCFVELTYISECACPAAKLDRYEVTRKVVDPITGNIIASNKASGLSAGGLPQHLPPRLTQTGGSQ